MEVHPETSHVTGSARQCNIIHYTCLKRFIHARIQDGFLCFSSERLPLFNSTSFRPHIGSNAAKGPQNFTLIAIIDHDEQKGKVFPSMGCILRFKFLVCGQNIFFCLNS